MSNFYNKYPYTDFHELNLDWVIERVKKLTEDWAATLEEWNSTEEQWQQLYDYVHDYFDNLNVQTEINNKIDAMILDGTFQQIATPIIQAKVAADLPGVVSTQIGDTVASQIGATVAGQIGATVASQIDAAVVPVVNTWLANNITQPTTPAIDTTLSIVGAAADAAKTGKLIANAYDATSTYDIGDYCNYQGSIYMCISTISTPEGWDATHWTNLTVSSKFNNTDIAIESNIHNDIIISKNNPAIFYTAASEWYIGSILAGEDPHTIRRLTTNRYLYLEKGMTIRVRTDKMFKIVTFGKTFNKISETASWQGDFYVYTASDDVYIKIVASYLNSDPILPANAGTRAVLYGESCSTYEAQGTRVFNPDPSLWEQGSYIGDSLVTSPARIRLKEFIFVKGGSLIIAESLVAGTPQTINYYSFGLFDMDGFSKSWPAEIIPVLTGFQTGMQIYKIPDDCYIKFVVRFNNSSDLTPSDINMKFTIVHNYETESLMKLNILALGDSICYGARNSLNGFMGQTGTNYKNLSATGASIAQNSANNIYEQLAANSDYTPDAIIFNGGTNDYGTGALMGAVPARVIDPNNDSPETMDKTTVMGGLNYLLYKMIRLYPNAQRIFVMPNKQWDHDRIAGSGGWNFDTFYENVTKVCKMYGVIIVDLYAESPINTRYAEYRSATNYSATPTDGTTDWVNYDGIHPLPYGYTNGIVPYVKEALKKITVK